MCMPIWSLMGSLIPRLSPQKWDGGRQSLVTSAGKVVDSTTLLWRYQSDCRMKPCLHITFCPLSKKLISIDSTSIGGEKQFSDVRKWRKSKFAVVGLQDRFTHYILQVRVYMYKVHHRTQHNYVCLKDEKQNCK